LLAFSFPFADATGELMTHEVCTFQDALGKCVTEPPSRASASQSSTASQKQTTSFVFRASAADMDLAPVVLNGFRGASPGGLRTGSRLLALQGPWPKRGSLRRRPSLVFCFGFWVCFGPCFSLLVLVISNCRWPLASNSGSG
jgi:hypothetical protein